jgi:hypothetical protein
MGHEFQQNLPEVFLKALPASGEPRAAENRSACLLFSVTSFEKMTTIHLHRMAAV